MPELSQEDQSAVLKLFQQFGDAWGRRDAQGCAAVFAEDGDLIAADGDVSTGPGAIQAYYDRQLSGAYKDLTVSEMAMSAVRLLGRDTAVLNGSWLLHGLPGLAAQSRPPVRIRWTLVFRQDSGAWRCVIARFMAPLEMPAAV